MSITLVVDRSLIYPNHIPELFELRNQFVGVMKEQLGSELGTVVAYSEVDRITSFEKATLDGPDYVYGSNLQHALVISQAADTQPPGSTAIVLVTYSLPSARHISGEPFFFEPPLPESLEAARSEFQRCSANGASIDVLMIARDADGERSKALQTYFRPIAEDAGGVARLVVPGDPVESVVERIAPSPRAIPKRPPRSTR